MVAEIAGTACRYRREAAWRPAPWAAFLITLAVPPLGFLYLQRLWMAGASLVLAVCALPFVLHEPALWAALAVLAALLAATLAMRAREPVARHFYATPLGLVLCLWVGVAVFAAGRAHVVGVYRVTSASMMPGIAVNDLLFVKRWEDAPLERGKVYLFRLGEEGGSFGVARGEIDLGAVDFGDGEGEV
ncbi:MAG: S26 family signal peptidase, partial [Pseudomonadota bacterium]